jgi:predicted TIM-barrel fold metal-dependent hydrolase
LKDLEGVYKKMPNEFSEHPVETFKRNVYVNPFWEDEMSNLIEAVGSERLLFGSDYPHPEGLANPISYVNDLPADLPHAEVARIMGGNLRDLLNVA